MRQIDSVLQYESNENNQLKVVINIKQLIKITKTEKKAFNETQGTNIEAKPNKILSKSKHIKKSRVMKRKN